MPTAALTQPLALTMRTDVDVLASCRHEARRQESCRRLSFWDGAAKRALLWGQRWEANGWIIEMGEDLLRVALSAEEASGGGVLLRLASTCRCLRALLLPRLIEKKEKAMRQIFFISALA